MPVPSVLPALHLLLWSRYFFSKSMFQLFFFGFSPYSENVEGKSSRQKERLFTRCLPIPCTMFAHVSECEKFSLSDCSTFAVECDLNGKIAENERNFGFFYFAEKKTLKYF